MKGSEYTTTHKVEEILAQLSPVLAMILNALDRDAVEGRVIRGEMAAELRAVLAKVKP